MGGANFLQRTTSDKGTPRGVPTPVRNRDDSQKGGKKQSTLKGVGSKMLKKGCFTFAEKSQWGGRSSAR